MLSQLEDIKIPYLFYIKNISLFAISSFAIIEEITSSPPNPILHTRSLFFLLISSFLSFVLIWQTLRKPTICLFLNHYLLS